MAVVPVPCPQYQTFAVVKYGTQPNGTSRYRCQHPDCARHICLLAYQERLPEVRRRMVDLTLNGSGVRDSARVLGGSSVTVSDTLKQRCQPSSP
jgi:transposase-like protein